MRIDFLLYGTECILEFGDTRGFCFKGADFMGYGSEMESKEMWRIGESLDSLARDWNFKTSSIEEFLATVQRAMLQNSGVESVSISFDADTVDE